jgi:hypothetical protein
MKEKANKILQWTHPTPKPHTYQGGKLAEIEHHQTEEP